MPKPALFRIQNLLISIPSPKEQSRIEDAITAHDRRIETEEAYLSKLKAIKKGLMQDLLTGRVRVPKEMLEKEKS